MVRIWKNIKISIFQLRPGRVCDILGRGQKEIYVREVWMRARVREHEMKTGNSSENILKKIIKNVKKYFKKLVT